MIENGTSPLSPEEIAPGQRLESWKEIATYLKKDVRTVQRWEKSENLPVYRHIHQKLPTVYAYKTEIDAWWRNGHERLALLQNGPAESSLQSQPAPSPNFRAAWLIACAIFIGVAGAVWYMLHRPEPVRQFVERQLTANPAEQPINAASISPDGKYLAYSDPGGLHIKLIDADETRSIAFPQIPGFRIWTVAWFPDQTKLAVSVVTGDLKGEDVWTVSLLSGSFHKLLEYAFRPVVSPDGRRIAFVRLGAPRELWIVEESGENAHRIYTSELGTSITQPSWVARGFIALASASAALPSTFRLVTVNAETGVATLVWSDPVSPAWPRVQSTNDGRLLFQRREYPPAKVPSTAAGIDIWQIAVSNKGQASRKSYAADVHRRLPWRPEQ